MITTTPVKGSPAWLDLGVRDGRAAADFYRAVFDWRVRPFGPEEGAESMGEGFGLLERDGSLVGALGPLTEEGARSAWMLYFRVDDVAAATAEVERLGGTVRLGPRRVEGAGRLSQCTDPQGADFALWQPVEQTGFQVADVFGALCWTELYTTDSAAAKEFYGALFGWRTDDIPLPGGTGTYSLVTPEGEGEERMQGGIMQMASEFLTQNRGRAYWHPVFAVADCDATVARVTEGGGSIQMGPETAEGVGRMAVCVDPFGADFVALTPENT
ncbi:VOC family protein [Streptomyces sp. NPDC059740]|uniref:VOC family protein n=1 Tax=Streptomyces sp. NPDC059740 TaxID=3346926 RepID=UPI00364BDA7F